MPNYLFISLFTFLLLFTQCQPDPFPKKDTNVLVVTANGITTKNPLSVSSKYMDPEVEVSAGNNFIKYFLIFLAV